MDYQQLKTEYDRRKNRWLQKYGAPILAFGFAIAVGALVAKCLFGASALVANVVILLGTAIELTGLAGIAMDIHTNRWYINQEKHIQ